MFRCYDCGREFLVLEDLMLHRKSVHNAVCKLSLTNECDRDQDTCWFNHPATQQQTRVQIVENVQSTPRANDTRTVNSVATDQHQQGFQETPPLAPPLKAPNFNSPEMINMKNNMMRTLKTDLTEMFKSLMNHCQICC